MYSKKDYMDYFLNMDDLEQLTMQQIVQLFITCIRNDSFKMGLQLYCRYLRNQDITLEIMHRLTMSIRDSTKFLEIKLFFIHQHFEILDVESLNKLIDVLLIVMRRHNYGMNPILSSYNTVKVSLLIYKVTYRVEKMNIYSLITKCQLVNRYIQDSLNNYLYLTNNIGQLYKFMLEPILDLKKE